MRAGTLALLLALAAYPQNSATSLRVLRATPQTPAELTDAVTITFDRPVSGDLDAPVDPAAVFSIEPRIAGRAEWRDPLTLRFRPAAPFTPGAEYTVTIAEGVKALDGSRLERAYRFSFRASAVRALAGVGFAGNGSPLFGREPVFRLLFNAAPPVAELERRWSVRLGQSCGGAAIPLRVRSVRRITDDDPWDFRYLGRPARWTPAMDSTLDLRRVVELAPGRALPLGCSATLDMPALSADPASAQAWSFSTYGPLRIADVRCGWGEWCPGGPIRLTLSTPVRGGELLRRLRIIPAVPFTIGDTLEERTEFNLSGEFAPRTSYMLRLDSTLTDVFGQTLTGPAARMVRTTGREPSVTYEYGRLLVERIGFGTLAVQHVNVDSLIVTAAPVPDSLEAAFLAATWSWEEPLARLGTPPMTLRIPVKNDRDRAVITGIRLPTVARGRSATLWVIRVSAPQLPKQDQANRPVALVQMTDLAVHARVGVDHAVVWVTGVRDGKARANVDVALHGANGRVRARGRTDVQGLVVLDRLASDAGMDCAGCELEGYVAAVQGADRAVVGIRSYDPDIGLWNYDISSAWGSEREPQTSAVFTERGIYRPGELVYAKAILRDGPLGTLRVPARSDSVQWVFRDRDGGMLRDTTVAPGEFGTSDQSVRLGADLPLGDYAVEIRRRRRGEWQTFATTMYRVAEYRPPEFLVEVAGGSGARIAGDSVSAGVSARYLFGAPIAHAPVAWSLRSARVWPWELEIPGADAYQLGVSPRWDEEEGGGPAVLAQGVDTLDGAGRTVLRAVLPREERAAPQRVTLVAAVTDANRQVVGGGASWLVHPAAFYLGMRVRGERWFWTAGTPVEIDIATIGLDGAHLPGIEARGTVVRREWHRVRRMRNGYLQEVGSWVADTVARCTVRTTVPEDARCRFTPPGGGEYSVSVEARDAAGRIAHSSITRWAAGSDWVPWNDDSKLKMDVVADRERYTVGDTATLLFASPFTNAEAWITIERERVLESRRIRITSGATTLRLPITEALAPNAFVSIVVVRGRSAPPGPLDDPGRPALRIGYAELRVLPAVKRLQLRVQPLARQSTVTDASDVAFDVRGPVEYRPGDSARIAVDVSGTDGRRERAEVTLWAVDQGVLALTGYRTPDPVELLYAVRGLGVRLASNLVAVAAQIPEGAKGMRAAGGGGGADLAGILRSRFQTTAFFLGSVVTDERGRAIVSAKLPDNLTTFRVMAVAVTKNDRYGSGDAELLVTRPLVARPALPRFVREGDRFSAGVVVNQRAEGAANVRVEARTTGPIELKGSARREQRVDGLRPAELRFDFNVPRTNRGVTDTARFTFEARTQRAADAVAIGIPVRSPHRSIARTVAGVVRDTATAVLTLQPDADVSRSRLEIAVGTSTSAIIAGAARDLRLYPYYCTEQVTSTLLPLLALYRAERAAGGDTARAAEEIRTGIRTLARRQHANGGIGYWSALDWTTPWLTTYTGRLLLEARNAGFAVDSAMLNRMAEYLSNSLNESAPPRAAVAWAYHDHATRLSERVAAAEFLSRLGRPNVAVENTLLQQAAQLRFEDRARLAQMLARRNARQPALQLLDGLWNRVAIQGRTAVLPPDAHGGHYFESQVRPAAMLLDATLAIRPDHRGIGALIETMIAQTRARPWNTQDYGWAVLVLSRFDELRQRGGETSFQVRIGKRTVLEGSTAAPRQTSVPLAGLVGRANGAPAVIVSLTATGAGELPAWWHVTLHEVPKQLQTRPVDHGVRVERWYELPGARKPITSIAEGELVRVRLRVTVPAERHFLVLDDALPAGLEAVDLSLRTVSPFGAPLPEDQPQPEEALPAWEDGWYFGAWDSGLWSPFDHKELRDDRVIYSASVLWPGTYSVTYLARATTPGVFVLPPAHAEEMYNPAVRGGSAGGTFTVTRAR